MKKILSLLLSLLLAFALGGCSLQESAETLIDIIRQLKGAAAELPETPAPTEDGAEFEDMLSLFGTEIRAGSAGCSLRAVQQAVKLMDWGVSTRMSEERITERAKLFLSAMDRAAAEDYMSQAELLADSYRQLLGGDRDALLETAGCADEADRLGTEPIPAVEALLSVFETPETDTVSAAVYTGAYTGFLREYYRAISERWPVEKLSAAGMNFNNEDYFSYPEPLDVLGFCVRDINADGVEELLIGPVPDGKTVNDIYSISADGPCMTAQGWARNTYHVCTDGTVVSSASNSAFNHGYHYYVLQDGTLRVYGCVIYDSSVSPGNPWFLGADEDWDVTNDSPVAEEIALSTVTGFEAMYTDNGYTPFSSLY